MSVRHQNYIFLRKAIFFSVIATAAFSISCNTGSGGQGSNSRPDSTAVQAFDASLTKGTVTDSITCHKDGSQTYALYLPSHYDATKAFPCIYFFDAHARGSLPVRAYKDIAEKYGFVLVGSNVSQNGTSWEVTNAGVQALMEDTRARINIDPKRIYTAGFSGGARVACSVAILNGGVAGAIGSAAGFPRVEQPFQRKFDYFGIVGDYDFNLAEMEQLDAALEQNSFTHQLLTSSGIHGWPSAPDFQAGFLWLQVNAMKEHLQPGNDTLVQAIKTDFGKRIVVATTAGEWTKAHSLLAGIIRLLNGLTDVSSYSKQLAEIDNSTGYKNAIAAQGPLRQEEMKQQQELQQQFPAQGEKWWAEKIKQLNQNAVHAKTPEERQMNKRVLNYLGLIGYMYSDHALKAGDLVNAPAYLKIFKMADPGNPDCGYLSATYYAEKGDKSSAIIALKESVSHGFNEVAKLKTDPAFSSIRDDAAFKDIIKKAADNYLAK